MTTASCARRLGAPAVLLGAALALAGCSGRADPTGPTLTDPIALEETAVTLSGTTVTTACFTFEMPTVMPYEINPASIECSTAIRPEGYTLGEIRVVPQKGPISTEAFEESIRKAAAESGVEYETWQEVVDGLTADVAELPDGYGLPMRLYQIPVRSGGFTLRGDRVTSIFISGHVGAPEMREALEAVVASLRVLN